MSWTTICTLSDIPLNSGVAALVDDQQVAIFRVKDALYAIDNHDPFSKANVLARGIVGCVKGELSVAAPLYKQHFSLLSGQCLEDDSVAVRTYPVRLEGDNVQVDSSVIAGAAA